MKPIPEPTTPQQQTSGYTFTGPEGLTISLKAQTAILCHKHLRCRTTSNGVTSYTVTLLDADLTKPGNQPFGDFDNGQPTNNDDNNGDGTYTQSTDTPASTTMLALLMFKPTLLNLHDLGRLISPTRLILALTTQSQAMATNYLLQESTRSNDRPEGPQAGITDICLFHCGEHIEWGHELPVTLLDADPSKPETNPLVIL